jgi:hypothetical protein
MLERLGVPYDADTPHSPDDAIDGARPDSYARYRRLPARLGR